MAGGEVDSADGRTSRDILGELDVKRQARTRKTNILMILIRNSQGTTVWRKHSCSHPLVIRWAGSVQGHAGAKEEQ